MAQERGGSSRSNTSQRRSSGGSSSKKAPAARSSAKGGTQAKRSTKTKAAREKELMQIKRRRQSAAVVLFAFAILMFVLVVFPGIGNELSGVVYGLFGLSGLLWCFLLFYLAILLALDRPDSNIKLKMTQATLAVLLISSFVYIISPIAKSMMDRDAIEIIGSLYKLGRDEIGLARGTGLIGGLFGAILVAIFKRVLAGIIVILAAFVLVMILTRTGLIQLFNSVSTPVKNVAGLAQEKAAAGRERREERAAMREEAGEQDAYAELRNIRFSNKGQSGRSAEEEPVGGREHLMRQVDIPIGEEPQKKSKSRSAEAIDEVVKSLAKNKEKKPEPKPQPAPKQEKAETSGTDSEEFEALLQKVAGSKSKKERVEEIAREAVDFAKEVDTSETVTAEEYQFPSIDILTPQEETDEGDIRAELMNNAKRLEETLAEYNVAAKVVDISRGPAVTRYELKPAPGVKISKITSLTSDIALRLAAPSVRIEAPIPGKAAVGVEIPNNQRSIVRIRELIDSEQFKSAKSPVTVAVGRDIEGSIILADLAKMPHLLIAGSTGMGKSVCINSMLVSLIYKSSPEDVRLIMVDPKKVELDVYNGIPQLLVPVVCDPKKAAGALQWAVSEMDKRYAMLNEHGVRNIDGYNALAEKDPNIEKMPRIVIVIDEMADLMATSPKEVESAIARLAAMARAAGIHMVLATQRPSVDVITGTIKNNIPSRIAFKVTSQIDSRTILDESGAEGLIDKGDMLFNPVGVSKPKRVQGCLVDDEEVEKAVEFIKRNGDAEYDDTIAKEIERNAAAADSKNGGAGAAEDGMSGSDDPMFTKAIEAVIEAGQASTSMLQRRLGVGYARAGRLIDQLAEKGVIGPFEGSKPRKVLMTRQEFLEMTMSQDIVEQVPASQLSILSMLEQESESEGVGDDDGFDDPPF